MLHRLRLPDKGPGIITHCHSERQYLSFRAAARNLVQKTGVALQILHSASRSFLFASGSVQDDKECHSEQLRGIWRRRMGQRTANKPNSYLIKSQAVTKYHCSRSLLFWGDHEQGYFALCCISINCEKLMFAVPSPRNASAHGASIHLRQQS